MKPVWTRGWAVVLLIVANASLGRGAGIKAGFAERDITPDIGMEQTSTYYKAYHRTFHDPCKVRVADFDDGNQKIALVGIDALLVPRLVVLQARAEIEKTCGIKAFAVMIGASHSRSSGPVGIVLPNQCDDASAEIRKLAYEDKVAFNRRFRMKNGQIWTHPGVENPDVIDYAGPIDPQVGVVGAWDEEGKRLGCIVNFSCHATTSPGGISANWPFYVEETIQGAMRSRAPVVFPQGACGDVTRVDNLSAEVRPTNEDWARRVGGRVGAEAVKVFLSAPRGTDLSVDARQKTCPIKRRVPSPARVARAREIIMAGKPSGDTTNWVFAKEILPLDYLISVEPAVAVEVQAIQVGPRVCISNPAECFVEYGLEMKSGSPFPFTFPVELANGCVGYVPTAEAFGPHEGGYETRLTSYNNLKITAGKQFAEIGIAPTRQLIPGRAPEHARVSRGSTPSRYFLPSTYGNVPPDAD